MIQYEVFIRAKTADDRWASVNAIDLDERSFKILTMSTLAELGGLVGLAVDDVKYELRTPLTKAEAEDD